MTNIYMILLKIFKFIHLILFTIIVIIISVFICPKAFPEQSAQVKQPFTKIIIQEQPFAGWKQVKSDHFVFIFEEKDRKAVNELLTFCEEIYNKVTIYFDSYPKTIRCVVRGRIDAANGFFSFFPNYIELFVTAPSSHWMGSKTENWLKILLTHELTHYIHLAYKKGFFAGLSCLFGGDIKVGNSLFLPGWMIEGITTNTETIFTKGGRGRNPFFEIYYKAPIIEDNFFSLRQASYSSYYPPRGRPYVAGYIIVNYMMEQFGQDVFARINRRYVKFPFFGPWRAIRKVTGKLGKEIFMDMKAALKEKYEKDSFIPDGKLISPAEYSNYYLPQITEHGLYLYRTNLHKFPAIVNFDLNTGKENIIIETSLTDYSSFTTTKDGNTIIFASYEENIFHPSGTTLTSDLYIYNADYKTIQNDYKTKNNKNSETIKTCKKSKTRKTRKKTLKQITKNAHLWQPVLSPDGSKLIAVQKTGSYTRLVEVDKNSGDIKLIFALKESNIFNPVFSPDGTKIAFVMNIRGVQDIYVMDYPDNLIPIISGGETNLKGTPDAIPDAIPDTAPNAIPDSFNTEKAMPLTGPDNAGEYYPHFIDNEHILFSSDRDGSLALYSCSISSELGNDTEGEKLLKLICKDPVAAYAGLVFEEEEGILYASYNSKGYCLKVKGENELENTFIELPAPIKIPEPVTWKEVDEVKPYYDLAFPPLLWLPYPSLINMGTSEFNVGVGVFSYGASLLGKSYWLINAAFHPTYLQPLINFSWQRIIGYFDLSYKFSQDYRYIPKIYRQRTSQTLSLSFPLISKKTYPKLKSLYAYTGINYTYTMKDNENFPFFNNYNFDAINTDNSLSTIAGIIYSFKKLGGALDFYSPWRVLGRIDFSFPIPAFPESQAGLITKGFFSINLPSFFKHQVIKLGIKASYTTANLLEYETILPRGMFNSILKTKEGRFLASIDYLYTIALLDLPLPFGFNLQGIGGGFHIEAVGGWNPGKEFLVFEREIYAGVELTAQIGIGFIPAIFLGAGVSIRFDPAFSRPFDFYTDIRPYFFIGTDSFSNTSY